MIDLFFQMALNNVCLSFVLAIIAAMVGITLKRPVITHLLWLLVFVKLLTPPFLMIPVDHDPWMGGTDSSVDFSVAEPKDVQIVEGSVSGEIIESSPDTGSAVQIK
jgi:hypothetical protein